MLINITLSMSKNSTRQEKGSALCHAANHGWSKIVLADVDFADTTPEGKLALSYAVQSGDSDTVAALLKERIPATLKDGYDWIPLHYAAEAGHVSVIQMLLKDPNVVPDSKARHNDTPLWHAAVNGHEAVAKSFAALGESSVDVDAANQWQTTPLMKAAKRGNDGVVRLVLSMETVNPDASNEDGCSVLWYAANPGHEEITKWLLETSRVDANANNKVGETVLRTKVENGHGALVKVLLTVGGAYPDTESLFQAVEPG
ncbi:ankyrin repeat-containing protein [Fusarium coicis]|nr:ankyrin repeat-containing protein [Fusarium coicis]